MSEETAQIQTSYMANFTEADREPPVIEGIAGDAERNGSDRNDCTSAPEELDNQANQVLELIHELKLLTDRACDTALREALHSAQVEELTSAEIIGLRLQLQEKDEALDVRDLALRESETIAREKIELLENALRDKDAQLEHFQLRSKALLGEIDGLNLRLNEAATAMQQAETRFGEFAEQQQGTITDLRGEVKAREDSLAEKDTALRKLDEQSCMAIRALERLLENAHGELEKKETELCEKEAALQAALARKEPVARLLKQIASESQKLMAGLREKTQRMAELENKPRRSFDANQPWGEDAAIQARLL